MYSFSGANASYPLGGVIQASNNNLYGTTEFGGANAQGSVYQLSLTGTLNTIYSFGFSAPQMPISRVIQGSDGFLYGTGGNGASLYKLSTSGTLTVVSLSSGIGSSDLIQGADGALYGANGSTVYKVTTTGSYTSLFSDAGTLNTEDSPLIQASTGTFYGTAVGETGGTVQTGYAFNATSAGTGTILATFNNYAPGTAGPGTAGVLSGLTSDGSGNFYGTTIDGGTYNGGTIYKITSTGSVTTLFSFLTPPSITTQPVGAAVLAGSSVTFSVAASGTPTLSYQWQENGVNISGATGTSFIISNASSANVATYTVVVSSSQGSVTSQNAPLLLLSQAPTAQTAPIGGSATFSVVAVGSGPFTYRWEFNGNPVSGGTGSSFTISNIQSFNYGDYSVVITDSAGSSTTVPVALTEGPAANESVDTPTLPTSALVILTGLLVLAGGAMLQRGKVTAS